MSENIQPNNKEQKSNNTNLRRSFLKKAAISAPIISTVSSKPVWGAGICALSGSLSGNLSNHGAESSCEGPIGRSPGYWAQWEKITSCKDAHARQGLNRLYNWGLTGKTPLSSPAWFEGGSVRLGEVMRVGAGTDSFLRHVVAAFLSAKHPDMSGLVPYTARQVKDAYAIVVANPGTQRSLDIIEIFDALFENHDETDLRSTPSDYEISDNKLAQLSAMIGVPSPRVSSAC